MVVNLVALFVSSALLSAALLHRSAAVLTVLAVLVAGTGSYNMCSTIIAVVDETVDVGALLLMTIYSSFGLGSLLLPPLAGTLLCETGARSYPLMMLALTATALALFILYSVLSRRMRAAGTSRTELN